MVYDTPRVTDYGSISTHTFTNTGQVPGVGPKGKDWRPLQTFDKFNEESDKGDHGVS
jgi:hypothetical protein